MSESPTPSQILTFGVAVGIGGGGILWGLSKVVTAIIVAVKTVTVTTVAGLIAAPWVAPVMASSVAVVAFGVGYYVLNSVVDHARRDLFAGILPVVSIWTGAIVDLSKEFFGDHPGQKALYAILAGALVLISGLLSERKHPAFKISAVLVALMPPTIFVVLLIENHEGSSLLTALQALPVLDATVLAMLTLTSVGVALWGVVRSTPSDM